MVASFKNYAARVNEMEVLGDDVCASLLKQYKENNSIELLERITQSYLRLVMKIAHEYTGMGVDYDELVALGNLGLMEAIKKYNVDRGTKFSVYAGYWIRMKIRRNGLDQQYVVKKGEHYRIKDKGISNADISLNEKISEDDDRMVGEMLESNEDSPSEQAEKEDNYCNMFEAIESNVLTDIERSILKARYGLNCEKKKLIQLGVEMNYSSERIRQLEKSAIAKLKVVLGVNRFDDCEKDIVDDVDVVAKNDKPKAIGDFIEIPKLVEEKPVIAKVDEPLIAEVKPAEPDAEDEPLIETVKPKEAPKNEMSLLDAATRVLAEEGVALTVGMMVDIARSRGYWLEGKGNNPKHVLYAWIMYDMKRHGEKAKFRRSDEKGKFCLA